MIDNPIAVLLVFLVISIFAVYVMTPERSKDKDVCSKCGQPLPRKEKD